MKIIYVDIGELGWSLYLSAHVRWLKRNSEDHIGIMTFVDRKCLYRGLADSIYDVPGDFHKRFRLGTETKFGLKGTSADELKDYFVKRIPTEYELGGFFGRHDKIKAKTIFEPYAYSKELNAEKEILVFPRWRNMGRPSTRNLPREFYIKLIGALCDTFPDYIIRTMGISSGSYSIFNDEVKKNNYRIGVKENADLQELIDRCQVAVAAVGSQSAPPKISLLQGVPTFMIGHQREKHMETQNWMSTKVEFYDVIKKHYAELNFVDCIEKIISFIKECQ